MRKSGNDLVVAYRAGNLLEADFVCSLLESHEIPATVLDPNVSSTLMHMGLAVHPWGVRVAVLEKDLPRAGEVLREYHPPAKVQPAAPDAEDDAPPEPVEASETPGTPEYHSRRALRAALMGLYLLVTAGPALYHVWRALRTRRLLEPAQRKRFLVRLLVATPLALLQACLLAGLVIKVVDNFLP
ncbi:MAG TPA: DUF2007 domain-containing protein [Phycisphaerae bacterium]|nr:DUF2007 domain-containing protein [Phycisphaerae bacterium]